ncbi:MAG: YqaE/Pmp3 family membrane protein [Bacteroidia bacterium]|nr:YqaE/Pmp3 family membrane protein [Bacteroidia bacterium]
MKEAKKINNLTTHNEVITSKTFSKTTYLKAIQNTKGGALDPVLLIILAIFIPPVAVFLYDNGVTSRFWLNLILTILGWVPGAIHALIVVTGQD